MKKAKVKYPAIFWFFIGGSAASAIIYFVPHTSPQLMNGIISWLVYGFIFLAIENKLKFWGRKK